VTGATLRRIVLTVVLSVAYAVLLGVLFHFFGHYSLTLLTVAIAYGWGYWSGWSEGEITENKRLIQKFTWIRDDVLKGRRP
jgi:hypothetical protein